MTAASNGGTTTPRTRKVTTPAPSSQADDDARGVDAFGHPAASTGSDKIDRLVKSLDNLEINTHHDLYAYCEGMRKLCHFLAVHAALGSGQLTAGAREMARSNGHWALLGLDVRWKMRQVTKAFDALASNLADAASDSVSIWSIFEREFDDVLNPVNRPRQPKGFHIPTT